MRMDHLRVRMRSLSSTSTVHQVVEATCARWRHSAGKRPGDSPPPLPTPPAQDSYENGVGNKGPRCRDPGWGDDAVLLVQRVCWDRWLPELKSGAVMRDELRSRQAHA